MTLEQLRNGIIEGQLKLREANNQIGQLEFELTAADALAEASGQLLGFVREHVDKADEFNEPHMLDVALREYREVSGER